MADAEAEAASASDSDESRRSRSEFASVVDELEFYALERRGARHVGGGADAEGHPRRGYCVGSLASLVRGWSLVFCCQEPNRKRGFKTGIGG